MSTLEKAIRIAVKVHQGQTDRYDQPYVMHVLRVMARCKTEIEKICAVLHDVVEDSDWTLQDLKREGFSDEVVHVVDLLTKPEGADYDAYVDRLSLHPIARQIKVYDLEDNMDVKRMDKFREKDVQRMNKYLRSWKKLNQIIDQGGQHEPINKR